MQQLRQPSHRRLVVRRLGRASAPFAQQVEGQHQAVPGAHWQHLVCAVGIKGSVSGLGRVGSAQLQTHLTPFVAHDELAPTVLGGQRDEQRGEHAGGLFGVAVADEKAAFVVDQQLVQLRHHRSRHAQTGGDPRYDGVQTARPVLALQMHAVGANLPGAPNCRVDQRLPTPAVGRAFGRLDELIDLHGQQRQRHRPDAFHLDLRPMHRHGPRRMKIPGCADGGEHGGQLIGDDGQGASFRCEGFRHGFAEFAKSEPNQRRNHR